MSLSDTPPQKLLRLVAAVVLILAVSYPMVGSGAAGAASPLPKFGVQFHAMWGDYTDEQRNAVLDKMAAAGATWVRIDVGWINLEPNGPGQYSDHFVALLDRTVDAARARGIKVLATPLWTPAWANGGAGRSVPPTNVADYARFMGWAASHFRGRVAAWEIWNEPNLSGFWSTKDPATYARLVKAAYPAIKAGDPNATVVAGAVALNDVPWLAKMYDAGARGYFDVLSVHPYQNPSDHPPEDPDNGYIWNADHIGAVHDLMVARGDGALPLWATEYGWSVHANTGDEGTWNRGVTLSQQADYLVRSLRWFADRHPYVTNVFWYNERQKNSGSAHEDGYGLLTRSLSPRPAYDALKNLLRPTVEPPPSEPPPSEPPVEEPTKPGRGRKKFRGTVASLETVTHSVSAEAGQITTRLELASCSSGTAVLRGGARRIASGRGGDPLFLSARLSKAQRITVGLSAPCSTAYVLTVGYPLPLAA